MEAQTDENIDKYLVFSLAGDLYASPLTEVLEVIETPAPKPMPNMVEHFEGVINLRGKIVGMINLPQRLGLKKKQGGNVALVYENTAGMFAVTVDKVERISSFPETAIDRAPTVSTKIPLDYLAGVAQSPAGLVTLVALNKLLSEELLLSYERSKLNIDKEN